MIYDVNGNVLYEERKLQDLKLTSELLYNSSASAIRSAFITPNGKVWMVTETKCYVFNGSTNVAEITLDHTVGHANTSCYDNGYAYISDWTDGTIIHVFAVDEANNTMTYSKDITVPTTHGRTQFWVFDGEEQIYSCGWDYEHSENSQYMVIELWKKERDGDYVLSWSGTAMGITMVQGMCVHNNKMYIIDNTSSYKHKGFVVVDLGNGTQVYDDSQTGTILDNETESITPITDSTFVVACNNGKQFLLTESY